MKDCRFSAELTFSCTRQALDPSCSQLREMLSEHDRRTKVPRRELNGLIVAKMPTAEAMILDGTGTLNDKLGWTGAHLIWMT